MTSARDPGKVCLIVAMLWLGGNGWWNGKSCEAQWVVGRPAGSPVIPASFESAETAPLPVPRVRPFAEDEADEPVESLPGSAPPLSGEPPAHCYAPSLHQATECGLQEFWLVDALACPDSRDVETGFERLTYWRRDRLGRWQQFNRGGFLAAMTPDLDTILYVHGYNAMEIGARIDSHLLARAATNSAPFRMVAWLWPANHQIGLGPLNNVEQKVLRAEVQGYYLARVLDEFDPRTALTLVGHSYGVRPVCAALDGLANRRVACWPLCGEGRCRCAFRQAILLAPALESSALQPDGRYGWALTELDRLTIFVNPRDSTLRLLARVTGDPWVLGLTGLPDVDAWGEMADRVSQVNVADQLRRGHWILRYVFNRPTRSVLASYLELAP